MALELQVERKEPKDVTDMSKMDKDCIIEKFVTKQPWPRDLSIRGIKAAYASASEEVMNEMVALIQTIAPVIPKLTELVKGEASKQTVIGNG